MRLNNPKKMHCQRGQALPLGIALILLGALFSVVLFNSGQLTSEKSRLSNTADAAVYSGLIWQARALNFQAYTNRAMVANQVSIAQLVSLTSWTNYGRIAARNVDRTIGWIPPLKPYTAAVKEVMTKIDEVVKEVSDVAIPVIDTVLQVLSETQRAVYVASFAVTPDLVKEVVEANDKRYRVDSEYAIAMLGENALAWKNFARRYDDDKGLVRKANVIDRSRDAFTSNRGWKLGKFYLGPVHRVALIKEGRTHLVKRGDEWAWMAKDTLSLHEERFKCSWRGCKWKHRENPIGWGAAFTPEKLKCKKTKDRKCQRWVRRNKKAQKYANKEAHELGDYNGVRAYYDLADLSKDNKDPRLQLRIEVHVKQEDLRTSTKVGIASPSSPTEATDKDGLGVGVFRAEDKTASDALASISSGEVFFERPVFKSSDELRVKGRVKQEYGNLFNPYWHVRLMDTSKDYRLAAWAIRSPDLISSAAGGISSGLEVYASERAHEIEELRELEDYARSRVGELDSLTDLHDELESRVDALDDEVAAAEERLADARESGADTVDDYRRELEDLKREARSARSELDDTAHRIEEASELATHLDTYGDLADIAETDLASLDDSITDAFSDDLASASDFADKLEAMALSPDALIEYGKDELRSALEDAIEEKLKEVLKSVATSMLEKYGGSIYDSATAAYDKFSSAAEEYYDKVIVPILDRIEEMRADIDKVREELEDELSAAVDTLETEIDFLAGDIDSRVGKLTDSLEGRIDDLLAERSTVVDALAREAIDTEIAEYRDRLASEPLALRASLEEHVDTLIGRKDDLIAGFEDKVSELTGAIEEEIASLEEKVEKLKAAMP